MTTDISEKGLETLIVRHMTGIDGLAVAPGATGKNPETAGTGYFGGSPKDFDRAYALPGLLYASSLRAINA
jgi:type I restriction enzyme R subunit